MKVVNSFSTRRIALINLSILFFFVLVVFVACFEIRIANAVISSPLNSPSCSRNSIAFCASSASLFPRGKSSKFNILATCLIFGGITISEFLAFYGCASFFAGLIPLVRVFLSLARARKSHSTWMPCQKVWFFGMIGQKELNRLFSLACP